MSYKSGNSNGKISSKVYIEQVLPTIEEDLRRLDLTLYQDSDFSHGSYIVKAWAIKHSLILLNLPHLSPDLSIQESIANGLKKDFEKERVTTERAAMARFTTLFEA